MGSACSGGSATKVEDINIAAEADEPPRYVQPPHPSPYPAAPVIEENMHSPTPNGTAISVINEPYQDQLEPIGSPAISTALDVPELADSSEIGGNMKLIYFAGLRLRAEPSRLILKYAEVEFEDVKIPFEEWPTMKNTTPMGMLPVLKTSKGDLCQSMAIARFLANKYGLTSKDSWESAQMDMLMDGWFDLINELKPVYTEKDDKKRGDLWRQAKDEVLTPFLELYTKFFEDNQTGFFVGNKLSWVDLTISDFLATLSNNWDVTILDGFSALRNHTEAVLSLPSIQNYLNERTEALI